MKTVSQLFLGFSDAVNYSQRLNKNAFNNVFVKNHYLDDLLNPNVYFLVGEKGTGKTAYATYLSNNKYKDVKAIVSFISSTDYEKFYRLKAQKHLDLTGYINIWKVILLLLVSKNITDQDKIVSVFNKNILTDLNNAIDEYYMNAFSPEITNVMKVIDESDLVAKIVSKYIEIGGGGKNQIEFSETRLQHNLYYIEKNFSDAISKLKINRDIILFIDGIDIRPDTIPYSDYLDCIKGLASAAWDLNTTLFANVKDSKGQLRIVLLLRPDIFHSLSLQNATNKLMDNSVFLDWRTTYQTYRSSDLYMVAKKIISYEQNDSINDIFESYFPWSINSQVGTRRKDTAFMEFLRISLSRPRDILVIMQYLQKIMIREGQGDRLYFSQSLYQSDDFQNKYSEYFMGSLKDQLSFYYSNVDFEHFLKLFDFFDGPNFTFEIYREVYNKYLDYLLSNANDIPEFVDDEIKLLQLLYDCNMITAIEKDDNGKDYYHFSYREKDSSNINPKVSIGKNITYRFHYGLYKKIRMGRY